MRKIFKKIILSLLVLIAVAGIFFIGESSFKAPVNDVGTDVVIKQRNDIVEKEDTATKEAQTEEKEAPVIVVTEKSEPQEEESIPDEGLYCTLSVQCSSVLENLHKLKDNKKDIIPDGGVILKETKVEFFAGESVFDVLHRTLKSNNILFEFTKTPAYNSVYIEGIANLYEFDCGELSGWLYRVNGIKPTYGCSQYQLENGDKIEFFYSCNMFE